MISQLAKQLPPYIGRAELIKDQQSVHDIVFEMLDAHKTFAPQYDSIASSFNDDRVEKICEKLFSWCKQNIKYKIEPEERQTTKSPAAMLAHGYGDCKHYASFSGGVLDALNRKGRRINWSYRFASYNLFNSSPEHVFVVVRTGGREHWIDPTPGADKVKPVWQLDKKVKTMPLYRISGPGVAPPVRGRDVTAAVNMLLRYGVMDRFAQLNDYRLQQLRYALPTSEYNQLVSARRIIQTVAIGGLFTNIAKAVLKVTLLVPRNAFLSLVGLNVFAYASKIKHALANPEGRQKLKAKWEALGGDFSKLENTVNKGATKKPILGKDRIGAEPATATAAWITRAGAIIAAFMPLVKAILDKIGPPPALDPIYNQPLPEELPPTSGAGGIMNWIQGNPLPSLAIAVAAFMAFKKSAA